MYTISLSNGVVLSVFVEGRSISEVIEEVRSRIKNVSIPGNLLDNDLKVVAKFDSRGDRVDMVETEKEAAAFQQMIKDLDNPQLLRVDNFTPTMNIYHYPSFAIYVRRCDQWTWIECFSKGAGGKTLKAVKVEF